MSLILVARGDWLGARTAAISADGRSLPTYAVSLSKTITTPDRLVTIATNRNRQRRLIVSE